MQEVSRHIFSHHCHYMALCSGAWCMLSLENCSLIHPLTASSALRVVEGGVAPWPLYWPRFYHAKSIMYYKYDIFFRITNCIDLRIADVPDMPTTLTIDAVHQSTQQLGLPSCLCCIFKDWSGSRSLAVLGNNDLNAMLLHNWITKWNNCN